MIQDVKTVVSFDTTRLDNSLYVGLISFTKDQFNAEFGTDNPAPAKIAAQLARYTTAYTELDAAYVETRKSSITPEIEAADNESDQLVIGIRQMVEGATRMTFDQQRQQQATDFYETLKKYKIDTKENYLAENNKILQWIEEVESSVRLEMIAQTLGLTAAIAQLKTVAQRLRQLITDRAQTMPAKERMRNARTAMTAEYRWLITALNAYAMVDADEVRFETLVNKLNGNLDYLKNTVLARKGSSSEEDGGDEHTPEPEPSPEPEPDVTPVVPE